jgi:hypothetical protein
VDFFARAARNSSIHRRGFVNLQRTPPIHQQTRFVR